MKTIQDIKDEVSAVQTSLTSVQDTLVMVQADLQVLADADTAEEANEDKPADPVVKLHVVTQSGTDTTFVPEIV